jgi:hypothetical protein
MYKPNGEEPMSRNEEKARREKVATAKAERSQSSPGAEALRSAFYAALFRAEAREDGIGATVV